MSSEMTARLMVRSVSGIVVSITRMIAYIDYDLRDARMTSQTHRPSYASDVIALYWELLVNGENESWAK